MNANDRIEPRYEVTQYDGKEVIARTMTQEEAEAIDPKAFDHFMSTASGVMGFRASDGQWVDYDKKWPRMGRVTTDLLRALQLNPGVFLTPAELEKLTGHTSLGENSALAARVHSLRETHHDKEQRFIETNTQNGYRLRWPKERTWLWIDRIPSDTDE